jgi:multidrug resistance efflux pump
LGFNRRPFGECRLEHDLATLAAAQAQVGGLKSQSQQADAAIAREQATLAQAKLNLSYTRIPTSSGSVANKTVQVRDFVQPGRTLLSVLRGAKRGLHHCELQRDPACIYARGQSVSV